jgi:hypothetical protein
LLAAGRKRLLVLNDLPFLVREAPVGGRAEGLVGRASLALGPCPIGDDDEALLRAGDLAFGQLGARPARRLDNGLNR